MIILIDAEKAFNKIQQAHIVAHAFNPSTREAEAGGFLSSRPAWSTE
jgi:major histocompatibility complex class I